MKKALLVLCLTGSGLLMVLYPFRHRIRSKMSAIWVSRFGAGGGSGSCKGCAFLFTDNVRKHQQAYLKEGIRSQKDDSDLEGLFQNGKLLKVETNSLYEVDRLSHSQPFILPKGHRFISRLATRYYERCLKDSLSYVPFTITSLTRSKLSVERLRKSNGNAIENSAHLKGKTFDISYRAFNGNRKQSGVFMKVLEEFRNEGKCYVKYERNGCLHVTVI